MAENGREAPQPVDAQKAELRKHFRAVRAGLEAHEKRRIDNAIFENLISTPEFSACRLLFSYVSVEDETDTCAIIEFALKNGRTVAVPRCLRGKDELEFYIIDSLESLKCGSYGLPEPEPDPGRKLEKTAGGLCLLPGLSFDAYGNRLGYGRGYYDRYLRGFTGVTAGLCGTQLLSSGILPCGPHDMRAMMVVTEKSVIRPDGAAENIIV